MQTRMRGGRAAGTAPARQSTVAGLARRRLPPPCPGPRLASGAPAPPLGLRSWPWGSPGGGGDVTAAVPLAEVGRPGGWGQERGAPPAPHRGEPGKVGAPQRALPLGEAGRSGRGGSLQGRCQGQLFRRAHAVCTLALKRSLLPHRCRHLSLEAASMGSYGCSPGCTPQRRCFRQRPGGAWSRWVGHTWADAGVGTVAGCPPGTPWQRPRPGHSARPRGARQGGPGPACFGAL